MPKIQGLKMKTSLNKESILYHYTSVNTLMNILDIIENEKICLRATHAKYFNDPFEYNLAISLLKTSMIKYEKENSIEVKKSQYFKKDRISSLALISGYPFLISFSENSDDLTMWRTYGADGKGVAIGFNKRMLYDYSNDNNVVNTRLLKCQYNKNVILKGLTNYWKIIYNNINFSEEKMIIQSFRLLFDISNFCFSIKRSEYKGEKEWRLCKNEMDQSKIKFLEKEGVIIPYTEHQLPREIISKIIVGPCVNKKLTRESIITFLKTRKYSLQPEKILMSKVPYRRI